MKSRFSYLLLLLIILLGIILRLYTLPTNFIFGFDQGEDIYKTKEIFNIIKSGDLKNLPIIGEAGTYFSDPGVRVLRHPVYTGVFYFYFILPAAILASFNPYGLTLFFAILNIASIYMIYLVGREFANEKVGLIAAFLFSTSYRMNVFSRAIWTPSPLPFFIIVSLYFLILIKKGKLWFWPLFLFSISAVSQIHDSGYYYMFLFLALIWILKLKFPQTLVKKTFAVVAFLLPIFPTIIYEAKTGFRLFPEILKSFLFQFGQSHKLDALSFLSSLPRTFLDLTQKFWEFWVSAVNPWQFDIFFRQVYGFWGGVLLSFFVAVSLASLFAVFFIPKDKKHFAPILYAFLLTFLAIPFVAKNYYGDTAQGLISGGATFSLIGGIPFLIIFLSLLLAYLWDKSKVLALVCIASLVVIGGVNALTVKHNIWENKDQVFDYSDKLKLASAIGKDSVGKKYDLTFTDPHDNGKGIFYLFDYQGIPQPVSFNGISEIHTTMRRYVFSEGPSEISYHIVGQSNWDKVGESLTLVFQVGRFRVYRKSS